MRARDVVRKSGASDGALGVENARTSHDWRFENARVVSGERFESARARSGERLENTPARDGERIYNARARGEERRGRLAHRTLWAWCRLI